MTGVVVRLGVPLLALAALAVGALVLGENLRLPSLVVAVGGAVVAVWLATALMPTVLRGLDGARRGQPGRSPCLG
jgi:hypothetical protein